MWLKTADSSTACETSTLKSPLLLGSDAPHVHPRLRKRLARCTLDCGFKTSESPALRGFVGGLRALATVALYLVIFSNGLHHSKNPPVKFGFSPKTVSANIARKLPSQRCLQPFLIPFFNFSHKWPTFAFTDESGYTPSAFGERLHTTAYTPKHGASLLPLCRAFHALFRFWTKKSRRKRMHALWRVSASFGAAAPLGWHFLIHPL